MSTENKKTNILWLRPTKPDNISVGRERVAEHLNKKEYNIDIQDASGFDAIRAIATGINSKYDIIIGTVRMGLYVGYILSNIIKKPLIGDVTDPISQIDHLPSPIYQIISKFEYFVLNAADETIFVYKSSYEKAKRQGINGKKVENAVDYDQFNDPDSEIVDTAVNEVRQAGIDDRPIVVYIGGLTPVYNVKSILKTAKQLDTVQFLFIGDGILNETVKSTASVTENVYALGTYEHKLIPGFLAIADVGLCLVDAEQPLKVLEYGAAGLPVVAITGELEERFSDEELWFIDSTDDLAGAVSTLVADRDLAQQYGTNLNQRAKKTQWSRIATEYKDAIDQAIYD